MSNEALEEFNRKQRLPFLFEVADGNGRSIYQYVLPINPENYECTVLPRVSFTYTQGGGFEDKTGMAFPKISMSGTFTYSGNVEIKAKPFNATDPNSFNSVSGIASGLFSKPVTKGPAKTIREGTATDLTGWDLYQEFAGMIFQFYELFGTVDQDGTDIATKSKAGGGNWNLAAEKYYAKGLNKAATSDSKPVFNFYNFTEEQYYRIQINKFVIKRSIQRRLLYQYDLQLSVLGGIKKSADAEKALKSWTEKYTPKPQPLNLFKSALNVFSSISNAVNTLSNLIDDASSIIDNIRDAVTGFVGGIEDVDQSGQDIKANASASLERLKNLGTRLPALYDMSGESQIQVEYRAVDDAGAKLSKALSVALSIDGLPHEFIDMLRQSQREVFIYKANRRLFLQTGSIGASPSNSASAQDPTKLEILTGVNVGAATSQDSMALSVPENTLFGVSPFSSVNLAVREVVIRGNDTIETIARDSGADWKDIAALNNLDYPYIAQSSPDGLNVLIPGQKIKLPGVPVNTLFSGNAMGDLNLLLYGIDEYLDEEGRQSFDPSGDILTVGGVKNVIMQLEHRQNTPMGELALLGHKGYGSLLQSYVGRPGLELWYRRALLEEERVLLQDPRVASVSKVSLTVKNDANFAVADVVLIDETSLSNLSLPLIV